MDLGDLNKVWEIKVLKKPGEEDAREMLQKIASQVQPIMRKHNWRVKVLYEFCPDNPSIQGLNVGGGEHIKLRLRRPNRDWNFIPYDQVLDTMLHELSHNAHASHNADFYKLWDELRQECKELISKGITGTGVGFDLPGRRLGGFPGQSPVSSIRQVALVAAEKRARAGAPLPSGPKRLGGNNNPMVTLGPTQAAGKAAARRLQDDLWCGSESSGGYGEEESSSNVPQKVLSNTHSAESSKCSNHSETHNSETLPWENCRLSDSCSSVSSSKVGIKSNPTGVSVNASTARSVLPNSIEDKANWECVNCTLFNLALATVCEACGSEKSKDIRTKFKTWSCKFCTLKNDLKVDKCAACEQWRYSYGAPLATGSPFLGT